jgi:tetratricopeptide (TPR) repeat protein
MVILLLLTRFYGLGNNAYYKTFTAETDPDKKAEVALELWNYFLSNDLDSLKIIGTELLHDAKQSQHFYGEAVAYRIIGDYEIWNGGHEAGRKHLKIAARYFLKRENYLLYSECLASFGNSLFMEGDLDDAEAAYLNALDAGKKSGDQSAWFAAELNLAKLYASQNDTARALELGIHYKNEALRLSRFEAVSNAYGFLYNITISDSILRAEYLEKSIRFAKKCNSLNQLSHVLNNAAIDRFYRSKTDSARILFTESLMLRKKANNHRLISEGYLNLAQLYFELNDFAKSSAYADSSIGHALQNNQNLSGKEGLTFMCAYLKSTEHCERLEKLEVQLDSLVVHEAKLLKDIITIYEEDVQKKSEAKGFNWIPSMLVAGIVIGLSVLIYKD